MLLLAAVMYSPNLGDGVIAECLTQTAEQALAEPVEWIDLAGRTEFQTGSAGHARLQILRGLTRLPKPFARTAMRALLEPGLRTKFRPAWRERLADSRGVIIGGGQLLADANLNFPIKINALTLEAHRVGAPVALHAVGVGERWSSAAARLFAPIFSEGARFISVRDQTSRERLLGHLNRLGVPEPPEIAVYPDPGLLASSVFGSPPRTCAPVDSPNVGIGIIHPVAIRTHSDAAADLRSDAFMASFQELTVAVLRAGFRVTLFSNGATEDAAFATALFENLRGRHTGISLAARPKTPQQLSDLCASFDTVIAHRLHAHILAYAHKAPSIGLSWDSKVDEFFRMSHRPEFMFDGLLSEPEAIADRLGDTISAGIDAKRHAELVSKAAEGVARAVEGFSG